MGKRVKCPYCGSTDLSGVDTQKKFSVKKSLVGSLVGTLFGPVGSAIGAANGLKGKDGKTVFYCCSCGKTFRKKL